jgi:hypothetical protein
LNRLNHQRTKSGKTYGDFSGFKHRPFSPDQIYEAARIITQMELHIVGGHIKLTEVDLGNNIIVKYQEE